MAKPDVPVFGVILGVTDKVRDAHYRLTPEAAGQFSHVKASLGAVSDPLTKMPEGFTLYTTVTRGGDPFEQLEKPRQPGQNLPPMTRASDHRAHALQGVQSSMFRTSEAPFIGNVPEPLAYPPVRRRSKTTREYLVNFWSDLP